MIANPVRGQLDAVFSAGTRFAAVRCPACAGTQCVPLPEAPPPPVHPERAAPGPPLTLDDLIDLHVLLHRGPAPR